MSKKAVLIGINYPNTSHELRGCINDVLSISDMLITQYQFKTNNIVTLLDDQATTKNILNELERLVSNCKSGDVLFFHYSGHGSQMLDGNNDNDNEIDGLDEILCPIDLDWKDNVIRDDDLKRIFDKIPSDVHLTVLLDCCHSGGGLDHQNQFQPNFLTQTTSTDKHVGRFLTPPEEVLMGGQQRKIPKNKTRKLYSHQKNNSMLISGCRSNQTSADAYIDGKFQGACSYTLFEVLKANDFNLSYKTLIIELNKQLAIKRFTQQPELNGVDRLFDSMFISDNSNEQQLTDTAQDVVTPIKPHVTQDDIDSAEQPIFIEPNNITPTNNENIWQKIISWIKSLF